MCASSLPAQPAAAPAADSESPAVKEARLAWFKEAKFGLFIHWGLYSIPAAIGKASARPVSANGSCIA